MASHGGQRCNSRSSEHLVQLLQRVLGHPVVRKQVAPVWVQPRVSMQQGGWSQPLELIWQDLQAQRGSQAKN